MPGPGVSPTSPRARATPHEGNKLKKKKKELVDIKKIYIIILSIQLYIKGINIYIYIYISLHIKKVISIHFFFFNGSVVLLIRYI